MASVASSTVPIAPAADSRSGPSAAQVVAAWCALAMVDVVMTAGGFARVVGLLRQLRDRRDPAAKPARDCTASLCAAIERARLLYPRRAWCLQAAAATTILLRLRGVAADMVIGVRCIPFRAHAWVEVDGRVVINEEAGRMDLYTEIERC